ncbi:RNA polymerase II elongation factor ELL-like isoform X2 [Antennarius striatus]|uniref:RNA polymerase II elongation factor ELL-like isoform X2 n=1 Tax=Antennarius striatus TaxID=241820 RepID=UPI0035AE7E20
MSALQENRSYGLSGGDPSRGGNVSVFHVKLTDSAARAIGSLQGGKGRLSHPSISFNGDQGRIAVPCSDNGDQLRIFTFGVTNVARDNPHGSFDCVQQISVSGAKELSCLGVIQKKMTINATDDSYDKARQSMAQAEEETRSRAAIVIKHEGRFRGKKVTVRAPAPALAGLTKPRPSSRSLIRDIKAGVGLSKLRKGGACALNRNLEDVQRRPLRERVSHLLALRPYKRPELILRLQRDGLPAAEKDTLESMLMEVGQLNSRDNTFVLKDSLYKELQKDWPGYTSGDQQLLKRILVRRLFQPQQNLLTIPEAQVSPLRDTPNSSPAHRPLPHPPEEYTDPLLSKKPRISHLSVKTVAGKSRARTSKDATPKDVTTTAAAANERQTNSLDPRRLFDSLSAVCQREAEAAERLEPTPCSESPQEETKPTAVKPQPEPERPPSLLIVPERSRHTIKRKKSKHKHKNQEKDLRRDRKSRKKDPSPEVTNDKISLDEAEEKNAFEPEEEVADYLLTYSPILSPAQRQSYKQDFNREYSEYRDLHAHIDGVTRQFMELDSQRKRLHRESHKYKTVHNKILHEYRKIKKSNPNYDQEKSRCEYLHNKLAHIKKLISQYDQRQLGD